MKKILLSVFPVLCACLAPLRLQAAEYVWDNDSGDWNWNNPVNWGLTNNFGYNVQPTASDTASFIRGLSPAGTVRLTGDTTVQKIRQDFARDQRTITIEGSQTVDRTLTLTGTGDGLIDCSQAGVQFTLDGTPNGSGARLKLQINGSGGSAGTTIMNGVPVVISCDVSGAGGFILNGAGKLTLSGADTYTGPTTVNSGTLLVNGSIAAASAVSVAPGATLGGTGTINGPVTIAANGLLSPGLAIGTLTVNNNLTLAGDLLIAVNKSLAPSNDMVSVSGTLNNTGAGTLQVLNLGAPLATGDSFKVFNKPLVNGQALHVLSAGTEIWTNKLAVDGSIAVLFASNPPITGDPTNVFNWRGTVATDQPWKVPMQTAANWIGNQAPPPLSSNILVFQGDLTVPYNWPYVETNYGTTIVIFSNNAVLNSIKVLAGSNNTVNLGSYMRQESGLPCYFGATGKQPVKVGGVTYYSTNAFFTNALGDASCGSQTEFQCIGSELDIYGVLKDGAGTHSRLVKSGKWDLNVTGSEFGDDANTYTGGTVVNEGTLKMTKNPGVNAIPGDVTVNGSGILQVKVIGGEQIADTGVVTLNDTARFDLYSQPETIGAIQSTSANTSVVDVDNVLTVTPSSSGTYNGGTGEADYSGSISGGGTFRMNGTGIQGLLGANSISKVTVDSGTLKLNGKTGTGAVTVNAGGTLLGSGTIAGAVTVASGGTIGAGFSAGKATFSGGLNMSASGNGATNVWELANHKDSTTGTAGTDFDQMVISGSTLALGTVATLDIRFTGSASAPNFNDLFWRSPHTWRIILLSGGTNPSNSSFGRMQNDTYAAGKFTVTRDSTGILLTFTPNAAPPRITTITRAGTGSVTVYYTNTMAGTNYILAYNTNLNSPSWFIKGNKTASGPSDYQTDNSAISDERYYRVYYTKP